MIGTKPTLAQCAYALLAFGALMVFVTFWPIATDNVIFKRAHATAWATVLLATPALYIFARTYGRTPLTNWWRLFWTAGWVMAVIHFYYGLFGLHDGNASSVFQRQGIALAGTIFLLIAVWGVDIFHAWMRPDWQDDEMPSRRPAFWIAFLAMFISTVLFNNDIQSLLVGLIMTVAVLVAVAQRVDRLDSWEDFFASELPPSILSALLIAGSLFGPGFLSTDSVTPSELAEIQARYTAWPVLFLGGVAAAILIARAPNLEGWGWANWQLAGLAAYAAHVYAGFWLYHGGSFSHMFEDQGVAVGASNLILLALWTASAAAAQKGWRVDVRLHYAAAALFMLSGLMSAYFMGGPVIWLAGLMALIWIAAALTRARR
ncbi:MAG: hypothetical protein AAF401_07325 [Pseudomonadota bacterium]